MAGKKSSQAPYRKPLKKNTAKGASSFVLMVGDEGGILVQIQRKQVVRRLFAQSPDETHVHAMQDALEAAPNGPITILVDMMDQSYVQQTLPPVSSFNVGKIIKRRMDKDFATSDIKGYVMLNREKTGRKDWNYMMVSLAASPLLEKWISFAVERQNPFKGIGLIPFEGQPYMMAIQNALHKQEKKFTPREWQILVSHQKVGGFRQIVLRNGKLAFTRMAQPVADSVPEVIAGHIEQEMINTLEYLKRIGLQDTSELCAVIVTSQDIKSALDSAKITAGESHFYTPFELATLLSMNDAAQSEDHFGDVVMAAFIVKRKKLLLGLQTPYTKKLKLLSMCNLALKTVASLGIVAIFGWAGYTGYDIYSMQDDIHMLERQHVQQQNDLNEIKQKAKKLPGQVDKISDIVSMVKLFNKRSVDAMQFLNLFAGTLQDSALITNYQWTIPEPLNVTSTGDKRQIMAEIDLHLTLPHEPKKDYIAASQAFIDRMKKDMPQFTIAHSALPGFAQENEEIKTVITDTKAPQKDDALIDTIKVNISGPTAATKAGG